MNITATLIFVLFFIGATIVGFLAANWRRGNLKNLDEWGLGGRNFGTMVTWFLLGGDLYTAYTFIAVPALIFGEGAIGFFALPYTTLVYPFAFIVFPKLWSIAKQHGYITIADFVSSRYSSRLLGLAIAITGIFATIPYIALQLVGIEVVIGALGFDTTGFTGNFPLIIAFAILAAYTYFSGIRAPAMIAIIKDILIYITVVASVIVISRKLGGFSNIFDSVPKEKLLLKAPDKFNLNDYSSYVTLVIGSALSLFLYPHSITSILSSSSSNSIRRNMAMLPVYSFMLGLLALLGYMALVSGVKDIPRYAPYFKTFGLNFAVPALFLEYFPSWFIGIAFAAIGIGALVPAAIMSIASANLYTRNIHSKYVNKKMTNEQETYVAKFVSLAINFSAVAFILLFPSTYAIQLQLLGGIWIIQTLPVIILGLCKRSLNKYGLFTGLIVGIIFGTYMAASLQLKSSIFEIHIFDYVVPAYIAVWSLIVNIIVSITVSIFIRARNYIL